MLLLTHPCYLIQTCRCHSDMTWHSIMLFYKNPKCKRVFSFSSVFFFMNVGHLCLIGLPTFHAAAGSQVLLHEKAISAELACCGGQWPHHISVGVLWFFVRGWCILGVTRSATMLCWLFRKDLQNNVVRKNNLIVSVSAKNLQCPDITVATSVFLSNKVLLLMCLEIMQCGRKIKVSKEMCFNLFRIESEDKSYRSHTCYLIVLCS